MWWACLCVCLFVCPQKYLRNRTRDLYQIFVHVAYSRGSIGFFFQQGDEIPREQGNFAGFFPLFTMHCTMYRKSVLGVTIAKEGALLGENVPDMPNYPYSN